MSAVVDLFAGPGGWDLAAHELGLDLVGIEWDDAACATRRVVGLKTVQGDVAGLNPTDFGPINGLIASPPCQAWSMAGKRDGHRDQQHVVACAHELALGHDTRDSRGGACMDPRSLLVVEPIRWVRELRPAWVALEQVPPVLGLWTLFAGFLESWNYRTWVGVLSAERYGVPQTRRRAILMASLDGVVAPPEPTHQEFVPGEAARSEDGLFGTLEPWVSMAEALGWENGQAGTLRAGTNAKDCERSADEPAPTMRFGERLNTVTWALDPRASMGQGMIKRHGPREPVPVDQPAPVITGKARSAKWVTDTGNTRGGSREGGRSRHINEPSAVVTSRADQLEYRDEPPKDLRYYNARDQRDSRTGEAKYARQRATDEPAPTIAAQSRNDTWVGERPATTVAGDERVHPPGHKRNADDAAAGRDGYEGRAGMNAVRVSIQEAAVFQSFPPDYPFQGTKSKQFQQVGNAIPPLLAWHILRALVPAEHL